MPDGSLLLSCGAYSAVCNSLSLAIAEILTGTLFFFFSRTQVGFRCRPAVLVSVIACYHDFRVFNSWIEFARGECFGQLRLDPEPV